MFLIYKLNLSNVINLNAGEFSKFYEKEIGRICIAKPKEYIYDYITNRLDEVLNELNQANIYACL